MNWVLFIFGAANLAYFLYSFWKKRKEKIEWSETQSLLMYTGLFISILALIAAVGV